MLFLRKSNFIRLFISIIIISLFKYYSDYIDNTINNQTCDKAILRNSSIISFNRLRSVYKFLLNLIKFNLLGKNIIIETEFSFDYIEKRFQSKLIEKGGHWTPKRCTSKHKIAIIIPYRNRLHNLKIFLLNMHPFLMKQRIEYSIYLIEPIQDIQFSRSILMNIGFIESLKDANNRWNCFFFHDVDMIPENINNIYQCNDKFPVHYAVAASLYNYKLVKEIIKKIYYSMWSMWSLKNKPKHVSAREHELFIYFH